MSLSEFPPNTNDKIESEIRYLMMLFREILEDLRLAHQTGRVDPILDLLQAFPAFKNGFSQRVM
jgi:hypothetical protein